MALFSHYKLQNHHFPLFLDLLWALVRLVDLYLHLWNKMIV